MMSTPPMLGSTTLSSSASFISSWPAILVKGKAGFLVAFSAVTIAARTTSPLPRPCSDLKVGRRWPAALPNCLICICILPGRLARWRVLGAGMPQVQRQRARACSAAGPQRVAMESSPRRGDADAAGAARGRRRDCAGPTGACALTGGRVRWCAI
jgi:hypothetical protein